MEPSECGSSNAREGRAPMLMLTCRDAAALAGDYLDGRLGRYRTARMRLHEAICPNCRRYIRQLRRAAALAAHAGASGLTASGQAEVMAAFRRRYPDRSRG